MAEPEPKTVELEQPKPAEDAKAAAALSSLDTRGGDDASAPDAAASGAKAPTVETQKALSEAMNRLQVGGDAAASKPDSAKASAASGPAVAKKAPVKIDAKDVTLLVDQLDISKTKATDLLKAHEGDLAKAVKTWLVNWASLTAF